MKKFIVILAFAILSTFLIGCGEEKVVEFSSLQQRGGIYVVPETQKPYSGKFVLTRRNIVIQAGSIKNGKLHGELTTYREDGSIDKIETFAENALNGKLQYYSESGKLMRVEHYKDGKKDGKSEYYDENGNLVTAQSGSFADPRDGKKYKTTKIGTQTWMTENLSYNASGSKCYKNDESNCQKYGSLYDWNSAMKSCPSGWHLPSSYEWQKLVNIAGGDKIAGAILKANSGWNKDGNSTDEFGFSALPGGYYSDGGFYNVGALGYWWSASEYDSYAAYGWNMNYGYDYAHGGSYHKSELYSVRCIEGPQAPQARGILKMLMAKDSNLIKMDSNARGIKTKPSGSLKAPSLNDIDLSNDAPRSKREIMYVINARTPGLWNIYNKHLKLKPDFSGKVTLKFTIAPSGDITSVSIVSSTTGYAEFDNAVTNMVATWKWKAIESGNTTPTVPFNFVLEKN